MYFLTESKPAKQEVSHTAIQFVKWVFSAQPNIEKVENVRPSLTTKRSEKTS